MPNVTPDAGYRPEIIEKVRQLQNVLAELHQDKELRGCLALKGGTALNLFLTDLKRLSVDIDLNFISNCTRDELPGHKAEIHDAIKRIATKLKLEITRTNEEHAGEKWFLKYKTQDRTKGQIQVDINYVSRTPLFPTKIATSTTTAGLKPTEFTLVNVNEIAAGKLVALLARHAPRDLFDAAIYHEFVELDQDQFRIAFVVLGASNIEDWTQAHKMKWQLDSHKLKEDLIPLLHASQIPLPEQLPQWSQNLHDKAQKLLDQVLPFKKNELEFITKITTRGDIHPELLTDDPHLQKQIASFPILRWKAENAKRHAGEQNMKNLKKNKRPE